MNKESWARGPGFDLPLKGTSADFNKKKLTIHN